MAPLPFRLSGVRGSTRRAGDAAAVAPRLGGAGVVTLLPLVSARRAATGAGEAAERELVPGVGVRRGGGRRRLGALRALGAGEERSGPEDAGADGGERRGARGEGQEVAAGQLHGQNLVFDEKWKPLISIGGTMNDGSTGPSATTLFSISRTPWLKRMCFRPFVTLPSATRKIESRVMPVTMTFFMSTRRLYQKCVMRTPFFVCFTISSTDVAPPSTMGCDGPPPSRLGTRQPWPVGFFLYLFAERRSHVSAARTPLSTRTSFSRGCPSSSQGAPGLRSSEKSSRIV